MKNGDIYFFNKILNYSAELASVLLVIEISFPKNDLEFVCCFDSVRCLCSGVDK